MVILSSWRLVSVDIVCPPLGLKSTYVCQTESCKDAPRRETNVMASNGRTLSLGY